MARRIVWAESAWNDLDQVAEYIAKDSRRYAAAFVREVQDAARSLAEFAERGRIVPEFGQPNFRELIVRAYRLIYALEPETVYILGFIHGVRDLKSMRKEEPRGGSQRPE